MFKVWQFLSKPFIPHKEEQHDEATIDAQPDRGLPTFHYEMPPSLSASPTQEQRTRNVVNIYPQVRRAKPTMLSPRVAYQSSISAAERSQNPSQWITPVEHSIAVLSADTWNMLKPVEWAALGGAVVHRSVKIPYGRIGVDLLFGKRRHVLRLIQRKATGVHIQLQGITLHLEGPKQRIHRLLDFLDHLYAQIGPSRRDYVIVRCKGPQLASKLERIDTLYKDRSGVAPFDRCSVVPMDDLHFTLARIKGKHSPSVIKDVANTCQRIAREFEGQPVATFILDQIAFESGHTQNVLAISSTDANNPISKLKVACKNHFIDNDNVTITSLLHMTIIQAKGRISIGDKELSGILPNDIHTDFLGPIYVDSIVVSRNIRSMLTHRTRHIPYGTFSIV